MCVIYTTMRHTRRFGKARVQDTTYLISASQMINILRDMPLSFCAALFRKNNTHERIICIALICHQVRTNFSWKLKMYHGDRTNTRVRFGKSRYTFHGVDTPTCSPDSYNCSHWDQIEGRGGAWRQTRKSLELFLSNSIRVLLYLNTIDQRLPMCKSIASDSPHRWGPQSIILIAKCRGISKSSFSIFRNLGFYMDSPSDR